MSSAAIASDREGARRALAGLEARAVVAAERDVVVGACLETLLSGLGADCAVLFLGVGRALAPWGGRSRRGALDPDALEAVARSLVERATAEEREVSWDCVSGAGPKSALELGIIAARAVPLGTPAYGALYVDFRDPRGLVGVRDDELLPLATAVLARALAVEDLATDRRDRESDPAAPPPSLDELLGLPGQRALRDDVLTALITELPVLVTGETGTGKTLLAQAIAERIGRGPVVRAMLGASDDLNTIASELFGHDKGAFSGAAARRVGIVEHADGGVLILDEIINLPLAAQQLLLDLVQYGTYRPLGHGGAEPRRAALRIIAVTNGDIAAAITAGRFRRDLFHRLAGVHLHVPPLRARRGDVAGIAAALLSERPPAAGERWLITREARQRLVADDLAWAGNTRELETLLRRACARALMRCPRGPYELTLADLDLPAGPPSSRPCAEPPSADALAPTDDLQARWAALQRQRADLDRHELELIDAAMARNAGVVSQAARALGIVRTTLASRLATRTDR